MAVKRSTQALADGKKFSPVTWAWEQSVNRPIDKAVLFVLSLHADVHTLACWVRVEVIQAEVSSKTEEPVRSAIDRLARRRLIASVPLQRQKGRGQTCSLYVLNPGGWLDDCAAAADVVATAQTRSDAMSGGCGRDVFPRSFSLCKRDEGLRLPSMF